MTGSRSLPIAAVTLFAAWFAWLNRGERIAVDVGVATFYRAPLTMVLFLAFLAGMLAMLLLSLRQDVRMREELRARGLLDAPSSPSAQPAGAEWTRPREAPCLPADDGTAVWPARGADRTEASAAGQDDATLGYRRDEEDPAA